MFLDGRNSSFRRHTTSFQSIQRSVLVPGFFLVRWLACLLLFWWHTDIFVCAGNWTQGLMHVKHRLYIHLAYILILKGDLLNFYLCMCVWVYMPREYSCPPRPEENIGSPWSQSAGSFELPNVRGAKLQSSGRVTSVLSCWAVYLVVHIPNLECDYISRPSLW